MNFSDLTANILNTLTPTFIKAATLFDRIDLPALMLSLKTDQETQPAQHLKHSSEPIRPKELDEADIDSFQQIATTLMDNSASARAVANTEKPLDELMRKYSNIPSLYNYTYLLKMRQRKMEEALAVLLETRQRFPDYLFGKIGLVDYYLSRKEFHKVPEVLEHKLALQQHIPAGATTVHTAEVVSFYFMVGTYYAETGNIAHALLSYLFVLEADETTPTAMTLAMRIFKADKNKDIPHKNRLSDFLKRPGATLQNQILIDDPDEKQHLMAQMRAALPIMAKSTQNKVQRSAEQRKHVKTNAKLKITDLIDLGDEGGIGCVIEQAKAIQVTSLTYLSIDTKHPLYKDIRHYQLNRIKSLESQSTSS